MIRAVVQNNASIFPVILIFQVMKVGLSSVTKYDLRSVFSKEIGRDFIELTFLAWKGGEFAWSLNQCEQGGSFGDGFAFVSVPGLATDVCSSAAITPLPPPNGP